MIRNVNFRQLIFGVRFHLRRALGLAPGPFSGPLRPLDIKWVWNLQLSRFEVQIIARRGAFGLWRDRLAFFVHDGSDRDDDDHIGHEGKITCIPHHYVDEFKEDLLAWKAAPDNWPGQ